MVEAAYRLGDDFFIQYDTEMGGHVYTRTSSDQLREAILGGGGAGAAASFVNRGNSAVPVDLVDTDSPPRVLMVVPPLSTFHGGEMLTLWGDNFAPHLSTVCVFTIEPEDEGEERFTAASVAEFRSANKIKCESPFSGCASAVSSTSAEGWTTPAVVTPAREGGAVS